MLKGPSGPWTSSNTKNGDHKSYLGKHTFFVKISKNFLNSSSSPVLRPRMDIPDSLNGSSMFGNGSNPMLNLGALTSSPSQQMVRERKKREMKNRKWIF